MKRTNRDDTRALAGALVFSRVRGYVSVTPGDACVLRAAGQTIRVRVRRVVRPGWVEFAWPLDAPARPSGWERWRRPIVRAGRLTMWTCDPPAHNARL